MTMVERIYAKWDGEELIPMPYDKPQAKRQFKVGRIYRVEVVEHRSDESHNHYFACLNTAFENLPEIHANRWRTPTELRKWCLCQTEFRDTHECHTPSHAEAIRVATYFAQMPEFSVCEIRDNVVLRHTPHSQDYAHMADREFQASKSAVLDVLANILGVPVEDLKREGGQAAWSNPWLNKEDRERMLAGMKLAAKKRRLEFTKQTKREAYDRSRGICECGLCPQLRRPDGCGRPLGIANTYYEHIVQDGIRQDNSLSNIAALCKTCWQEKTARHDLPTIAKSNRVRDRARGIR